MPQQPQSVARYGPGVPTPPPKAKTPTWVIVGITVLAVCCIIPTIIGAISLLFDDGKTTSANGQGTNTTPPPPAAVVTTDTPPPPATSAPPPPPPAPAGPATSFGPGMYEVGVDIKAGTYTCTATGFGGYWERNKNASGEFNAIIANEAFDAGAKSIVTVKAKEFFKVTSAECVIR